MQTIGQSVLTCRKERNVTQKELAMAIGKNVKQIYKLENDKGAMESVYLLCDIADYLNVSLDALIGRKFGEVICRQ